MKVRITFRSEIFFEGENMKEIVEQWMNTPLYSEDARKKHYADFLEIVSVEDEETYEDIEEEFNAASEQSDEE